MQKQKFYEQKLFLGMAIYALFRIVYKVLRFKGQNTDIPH